MRKVSFDILVNGMDKVNLDKKTKFYHKTLFSDNLNNILFSKFNNTNFKYKLKNKDRINRLKEMIYEMQLYKNINKGDMGSTSPLYFKINEERLNDSGNHLYYNNSFETNKLINFSSSLNSVNTYKKNNALECFKKYNEISKDNLFKDNVIYLEKESIRLKNISIFIEDNKIKDIELSILKSINSDLSLFFLNESLKEFDVLLYNNEIDLDEELVSFYSYFKYGSLLEFDKFKNFHVNNINERKYDFILDKIENEIKYKFPLLEKFKDNFKFENDSVFHSYNYLDLILGNKKVNTLIPSISSIDDINDTYSLINLNRLNLVDINNSSFRFNLNDTYLFNKLLDKHFLLNEDNMYTINKNLEGNITVTSNTFPNSLLYSTNNDLLEDRYTIRFDKKIFKSEKEKVLIETMSLEDFINRFNKTNIFSLFEIVMKIIESNFKNINTNKKINEKIKESYYLNLKIIGDNVESTLKRNYFNDTINDINYTYKNNENVSLKGSFFKDFYESIYDLKYIEDVEDFKNKIDYFLETLKSKFRDVSIFENYSEIQKFNSRLDNSDNIISSDTDILNMKCEILNAFFIKFVFNTENFSKTNVSIERYLNGDNLIKLFNSILKDSTLPLENKIKRLSQMFILNYLENNHTKEFYLNNINIKNYFTISNLKTTSEIDLLKDFISNLVKDIYKDLNDEFINIIENLFIYGFSDYIKKVTAINGFLEIHDRTNVIFNTEISNFNNYNYISRSIINDNLIDFNLDQDNNFAFAN